MGITIHYSGRAKNWDSLTRLLSTAQMFAAQRGWMFAIYDDPLGVMDDRDKEDPGFVEHDGPFRGIVIRPHKECEPVRLDFNTSNELTPAFTKTQYAPFKIHVEIVALLREIALFMDPFEVIDEAGLWESGDQGAARAKFDALGAAINAITGELKAAGFEVEGPDVPTGKQPKKPARRARRDRRPEEEPYG